MSDNCIHSMCSHNRDGSCLDPMLKDPYKQTGCLLFSSKIVTDYPKDENCKFCMDRWNCWYKEKGVCPREGLNA